MTLAEGYINRSFANLTNWKSSQMLETKAICKQCFRVWKSQRLFKLKTKILIILLEVGVEGHKHEEHYLQVICVGGKYLKILKITWF